MSTQVTENGAADAAESPANGADFVDLEGDAQPASEQHEPDTIDDGTVPEQTSTTAEPEPEAKAEPAATPAADDGVLAWLKSQATPGAAPAAKDDAEVSDPDDEFGVQAFIDEFGEDASAPIKAMAAKVKALEAEKVAARAQEEDKAAHALFDSIDQTVYGSLSTGKITREQFKARQDDYATAVSIAEAATKAGKKFTPQQLIDAARTLNGRKPAAEKPATTSKATANAATLQSMRSIAPKGPSAASKLDSEDPDVLDGTRAA